MSLVRSTDLRKMWDDKTKGPRWTLHHIHESIEKGELDPHDFSLRDMVENLVPDGREFVRLMNPRARSGGYVYEAANVVDTAAFSHITGQLAFSTMQQAMKLDDLIGDQLVTVMPSNFLEAEIVPGISNATDEFDDPIPEGEPYPLVGLSEEYVTIPRSDKRGGILGITREMVIADRTGFLIERARSIGAGLAIRREKSILGVFIGGINPYIRNGQARNTYDNAADATMGFDNLAGNALVNYTDIEENVLMFRAMRDPNTNEPLGHHPDTIVVAPALEWTTRQILHSTSIREGDITAAPGIQMMPLNPVAYLNLKLLTNEYLIDALRLHDTGAGVGTDTKLDTDGAKADAFWFIGKPKATFVWKEIWPLTVVEAPSNNEAEFTADVWFRLKASYRGVAGVREPRLMIRSGGV